MRILAVFLLASLTATPALAQLQQTYNTVDPTTGATMTAPGGPSQIIINTQPAAPVTETHVLGQPVTPVPAPGTTITTVPATKQSIGFDAKVKRDPNGNIIPDTNGNGMRQSEFHGMRNDNNLRNDNSLMRGQ